MAAEQRRRRRSEGTVNGSRGTSGTVHVGKNKGKRRSMISANMVRLCGVMAVVIAVSCLVLWVVISIATMARKGSTTNVPLNRVTTPHPSANVAEQVGRDRLWGTYRSGLYAGVRARLPVSPLFGVMWMGGANGKELRHEAQDSDNLDRFGWLRHDGRGFGRQEIVDNGIRLETSWVLKDEPGTGAGGDWAMRIAADEHDDGMEGGGRKSVSLFFYAMMEPEAECVPKKGDGLFGWGASRIAGGVDARDGPAVRGKAPNIGEWSLFATNGSGNSIPNLRFTGVHTPHTHNVTEAVRPRLMHARRGAPKLLNDVDENANLFLFQIQGSLPLTFDLTFLGGCGAEKRFMAGRLATEASRLHALSGSDLTKELTSREGRFDKKFAANFPSSSLAPEGSAEVAKAALSNTIGSIGYFYGCSIIQKEKEEDGEGEEFSYWPAPLLTAVPSRSFFPRGFLWDEGFHQHLVSFWDPTLSRDIIAHWLDLMNIDGWIPREQILGTEARSRVPSEFVNQLPSVANPPAMLFPLQNLVDSPESIAFLKKAWPRLKTWYGWYFRTQQGKKETSFRWRGRKPEYKTYKLRDPFFELNPKTLASGLDDYPRASNPSEDERHLDLRCWLSIGAKVLAEIGEKIGAPDIEVDTYWRMHSKLSKKSELNALHYDKDSKRYLDFGFHSEDLLMTNAMEKQTGITHHFRVLHPKGEKPRLQFVPHFGYNSLFPLIARILPPESKELVATIRQLRQPDLLWSDYGLRSLSKDSSIYNKYNTEHDGPYWRGPVWINLNYLVLSALKAYGHDEELSGPHSREIAMIYHELRANLLKTIVDEYHRTGYLWESYDDTTGHGKGTHPFTGWTALFTLIMGERYV